VVSAEPGFTVHNAATIAELMQRTVVVIMRDGDAYRLWRAEPDSTTTEVRSSVAHIALAAQALIERTSLDLRFASPRAITVDDIAGSEAEDAPSLSLPNSASPLPAWRLGVGLGAVAAGGGLFTVGLVLHLNRAEIGGFYKIYDRVDMEAFPQNQEIWINTSLSPTALTAFAGGAVAALGAGLLMREHERVPWWAWAIGGAGVVVAGSALIPVLTRPACLNERPLTEIEITGVPHVDCVDRDLAGSRATLIAASSLPLLAVPLSALLQSGSDPERALSPSIDARTDRIMVSLSRRF
jgi:hypothetical protein